MIPFCTDDDLAISGMIERFAVETIAPRAKAIDEESRFAGEHLAALADMGLTGMNLPEQWGGPGVSPIALYLAVEALAAACASTTSMLTAHFLATDAILIGGDDRQRGLWLPKAARGEALGAFALTEPKAGSNPADMRARGRRWRYLPSDRREALHLQCRPCRFSHRLRSDRSHRRIPGHQRLCGLSQYGKPQRWCG